MGNIANKRGGGLNAPPSVYTAFGDIDHGPNADPVGAVVWGVVIVVGLAFLGLVLCMMSALMGPSR